MTGLLATNPQPCDVPGLAEEALWQELALTPKPGLVDKLNNGAHRDMDHALFTRSIAAITRGLRALQSWVIPMRINPRRNKYGSFARWALPVNRQCTLQRAG